MLRHSFPILVALTVFGCPSRQSSDSDGNGEVRLSPKSQPKAAGAILDGKELKDNGNDPSTAGCLETYTSTNQTCQNRFEQWGDWCASVTHINERVDPPQCSNQQFAVKNIDCRTHLNDQRARCVEVPNHCPLGNVLREPDSAVCVVPPVP